MQQRNGKWEQREIVNGIKRQTKCNEGGRERWRSEREAQDLAAL